MPTTKRRPAAVRLPSFATFAAWPLTKRTTLFARWLKAQPRRRTYDWLDTYDCPLGQFATALHGVSAEGAVNDIVSEPSYGGSLLWVFSDAKALADALSNNTTFGAASDAFSAALKANR